jgi:acyl-CoA synthetase (AMP-forming)/AMP-acid ligase II
MTLASIAWAGELAVLQQVHGPRIAVADAQGKYTFDELAARAGGVAIRLRGAGAKFGEPVATSLRNGFTPAWVAAGLRAAGVAEVALNPALTTEERAHCLALSGARRVVTSATAADSFAQLGCEVLVADEIAPAPDALATLPPAPGDAWGRISFTSGTTGRPKAIVHTHAARWVANLLQRASFGRPPGPGSSVLLVTPFNHGAGILAQAFHDCGAGTVILDGVDTGRIAALLEAGELDHVFAPPTVLAKLTAALDGRRFPQVRTVFCGTAPLVPPLYLKARKIFGPTIRLTYGKTEIVNPITVLTPGQTDAYYAEASAAGDACVGFPASGVEVAIRGDADAPCHPGETGQVFLRAQHMLHGHIDAAGFHALPPGGFHDTGDLGFIDASGRLHLVGRMADVVKSGGYNVHPDEVERVMAPPSGGGHIAVVSLPSEYWGEVLIAVGERCAPDWVGQAETALRVIARYKHPRAYVTLDPLPRNAQGKVMRRAVREALLRDYCLIDGPHPALEAAAGAKA